MNSKESAFLVLSILCVMVIFSHIKGYKSRNFDIRVNVVISVKINI